MQAISPSVYPPLGAAGQTGGGNSVPRLEAKSNLTEKTILV
jgi:hypothetical protein